MIRKIAFAFLSITIIITLWRISFGDYAASIIPGWHTTILSPFQSFTIIIYGWLLIVCLLYIFYLRKRKLSKNFIIIYLTLTLPILLIKMIIKNLYLENYDMELLLEIIYFVFILFCLGQLFLIAYLIKKKPVS